MAKTKQVSRGKGFQGYSKPPAVPTRSKIPAKTAPTTPYCDHTHPLQLDDDTGLEKKFYNNNDKKKYEIDSIIPHSSRKCSGCNVELCFYLVHFVKWNVKSGFFVEENETVPEGIDRNVGWLLIEANELLDGCCRTLSAYYEKKIKKFEELLATASEVDEIDVMSINQLEELEKIKNEKNQLQAVVSELQAAILQIKTEMEEKEKLLEEKERELREKDKELEEKDEENRNLKIENKDLKIEIAARDMGFSTISKIDIANPDRKHVEELYGKVSVEKRQECREKIKDMEKEGDDERENAPPSTSNVGGKRKRKSHADKTKDKIRVLQIEGLRCGEEGCLKCEAIQLAKV